VDLGVLEVDLGVDLGVLEVDLGVLEVDLGVDLGVLGVDLGVDLVADLCFGLGIICTIFNIPLFSSS